MFVIGNFCKLVVGQAGAQASTEVGIASNVKVASEIEEVDATCRKTKGNKAYIYGLSDSTMTFRLKYDPEDASYQLIRNAHIEKKQIAAGALDDKGDGPEGDWIVSKFELDQQDNDIVGVDVTLRPSFSEVEGVIRTIAWIKASAS